MGKENFLIWLFVFGYLYSINRRVFNVFGCLKGYFLVFVKY